jgi:hypothetical protein
MYPGVANAQPQEGTDPLNDPLAGAVEKPKEAPRPPIARKSDPSPPLLWNFAVLLLITGAVFGANMIPSKRGHQD